MIDIVDFDNGDLRVVRTTAQKGKNLFETQLGKLEYAPDFGIDMDFFMQEGILFQNEAFRTYLLQRLAENSIDVSTVLTMVETFSKKYSFNLAPIVQDGLVR